MTRSRKAEGDRTLDFYFFFFCILFLSSVIKLNDNFAKKKYGATIRNQNRME